MKKAGSKRTKIIGIIKADIITSRIVGRPRFTQVEISRIVGCSRERVRQIVDKEHLSVPRIKDLRPALLPEESARKFGLAVKKWLRSAGYRYCCRCRGVDDRVCRRPYCRECFNKLHRLWSAKKREEKTMVTIAHKAGCPTTTQDGAADNNPA
jgi:hypothetical protein